MNATQPIIKNEVGYQKPYTDPLVPRQREWKITELKWQKKGMHWSYPEESGNRTSYIKAREPMLKRRQG